MKIQENNQKQWVEGKDKYATSYMNVSRLLGMIGYLLHQLFPTLSVDPPPLQC